LGGLRDLGADEGRGGNQRFGKENGLIVLAERRSSTNHFESKGKKHTKKKKGKDDIRTLPKRKRGAPVQSGATIPTKPLCSEKADVLIGRKGKDEIADSAIRKTSRPPYQRMKNRN